jgi:hypothetical protein
LNSSDHGFLEPRVEAKRFLAEANERQETTMRKTLFAIVAIAPFVAMPTPASAHDPHAAGDAAAGAAVGAGAGFLFGGPIGAAIGAGVGGTVGASSHPHGHDDVVIEERRRAPVRERSCTRDSRGNVACEEIRR